MTTLQVPVTSDDHTQGNPRAPVTLVEYGDYECPSCGLTLPIVKTLRKHFGNRLRFVFRNFPLTQIHPGAESAAETAEFADAHKRFWEMHDALYENQDALGLPLYLELAEALRLPGKVLSEALEQHSFAPKVRDDFLGGLKSGVNGTPTFFVNGLRYDGSLDIKDLMAAIDTELARSNRQS